MPRVAAVNVDLLTMDGLVESVVRTVSRRESRVFVGLYASLATKLLLDRSYRRLVRASQVYPDGMGVVWALRLRGFSVPERLATTDIVWPFLSLAEEMGWRVLLYGGRKEVVERLRELLLRSLPSLKLVGVVDGYTHLPPNRASALRPHLVLVARGAPLQESWAHEFAASYQGAAILTCGGLFDFLSGSSTRAPKWMQRNSLEWLYRILREPSRLTARYVLGNLLFVAWELAAGAARFWRRGAVIVYRKVHK
ncbi:MAG: WecB/TagA/CpsF family glycosyltransferase [Actinomycetales bacterium]